MAKKTALWARTLLPLLAVASALVGQGSPIHSPIQWPVPPPGPPRPARPAYETAPILISAAELARSPKEQGAILLDAGGGPEFEKGHPPGAAAAWSAAEEGPGGADRVRSLLAARGITGRERVVLYGADREAVARLFWRLRRAGCAEVRILDGEMASWRETGMALETGPSRRRPAERFLPAAPDEAAADAGWVASMFGQEGIALLDVRDARGWDRWATPPTFAAGHIPHSLPFDPRALLPKRGGWPDPAELRHRLAALGPRAGDPIPQTSVYLLYGEDGGDSRADLGYLLLTLAGLEAKVFPGGWREWTAEPGRPVVRVISAADLAARLKKENPGLARDREPRGFILLDLREPRDFEIGHLPGARSLPFQRFPDAFESTAAAGRPPGANQTAMPLILYCYGIECVRSREAGVRAARLGYRDILWFRGGVREWRQAGYPLLDSPPPTPSAAPERPRPPAGPGRGTVRP